MKRDDSPIYLLLIEDNHGDALLVEEYLADVFENAELIHVTTFHDAKKKLQENHVFDAILLDLSLPDSEGVKLIEETIKLAGASPVIILTGYTNLEFSMESLSRGVSDYLVKDELSSTLLHKSIVYSIERNTFSVQLKESEKNYRDLFELSPQPMYLFDLDTLEFLDVNRAAIDHYGYNKEEFLTMTIREIRPEEDIPILDKLIEETKDEQKLIDFGELRHRKKNGAIIRVEIHTNNVRYKNKFARIVLVNDVTEKRKEEERLKMLESVITNTTESVIILEPAPSDAPGRKILYVNDAFTSMTGYSKNEILGRLIHFLNGPMTDAKEVERLSQSMDEWRPCKAEFINYRKNGTPFWISTSLVPVKDENGRYTHWVAIGRDISRQKANEKELKDSLSEKEVLLSEIHHRVKNNLAIVSGMMLLQAFDEENKEVERRLQDSILRIKTMATIHELLYETNSFSQVNFTQMIEKLLTEISYAMQGDKEIEIDIIKNPLHLNINQAIPCALMINEVLTNAYKHAFNEKESGLIRVEIQTDDDEVFLSIKDNGAGMQKKIDVNAKKSLGMNLVEILSKQLHGEYSYTGNQNGTTFTITFLKRDVKGAASARVI